MIAAEHQSGIVHLIGAPGNARAVSRSRAMLTSPALCARMIADGAVPNAPVIVLGQDRAAEHAEAVGLNVHASIAPPLGQPRMARRSLYRIAGGADRIICWCDDIARLAAGMADEVELISTSPDRTTVPHRRFSKISCFTEHDQRIWRERGAGPGLLELPDLGPIRRGGRQETRRMLGIHEPTIVLAALADSPCQSDARGVAFLATVLQETGYEVSVIVPALSGNLIQARRHHRARGSRYRMIVSDRPPFEWLPAVDFVVAPAGVGTGSDAALMALVEAAGAEIVRLGGDGKATLAHAKHTDGSLIDRLDIALERSRSYASSDAIEEHAHA